MNTSSDYIDPLEFVWHIAAKKFGFSIQRTCDAYASNDGKGTIFIASAEDLDADDSMAQMILHELCHALVQGEAKFYERDWGFGKEGQTEKEEIIWEHAALRLQASLLQQYGLRDVFIPTTPFRAYYQNLPENPMDTKDDPCAPFLRLGIKLANKMPYREILHEALLASYRIVSIAQSNEATKKAIFAEKQFIWNHIELPKIHITGRINLPVRFDKTCGDCQWFEDSSNLCKKQLLEPQHTLAKQGACSQFEGEPLVCQLCAACCRAFEQIPISQEEFVSLKTIIPDKLLSNGDYTGMRYDKTKGACSMLKIHSTKGPFDCAIYSIRPQTCREVERYSQACLFARQKEGFALQSHKEKLS